MAKQKFTTTLDEKVVEWLEKKAKEIDIEPSKKGAACPSRSDVIEWLARKEMTAEQKKRPLQISSSMNTISNVTRPKKNKNKNKTIDKMTSFCYNKDNNRESNRYADSWDKPAGEKEEEK